MLYQSQNVEMEAALTAAQAMCAAARTAPKAKGVDMIVTAILTDETSEELAKQMEAMAPDETSFFIRDAGCIRKSQAVVLIGTRYSKRGLDTLCGLCNYSGCADCTEKGAVCVFDPMDLGIAIGSAVSAAADYRVDTRVMFSAGMAAKALGFLGDDVKAVMAIPVSVSGKSPFFDR